MTDSELEIYKAVLSQLAIPHKCCDDETESFAVILQRTRALWKLRWRHANTMVLLFENIHNSLYYTACGEGPCSMQWVEEVVPGKHIEYKHTPREWTKIWQKVAEKLLNKVREANTALQWVDKVTSAQKKKTKRNCPNCICCLELQEEGETYKTFCTSCGHWLNWNKKLNCTKFVSKEP